MLGCERVWPSPRSHETTLCMRVMASSTSLASCRTSWWLLPRPPITLATTAQPSMPPHVSLWTGPHVALARLLLVHLPTLSLSVNRVTSSLCLAYATRSFFDAAGLPPPPPQYFPRRDRGASRPILQRDLRPLFAAAGRVGTFGSDPPPPSSPACSICCDAGASVPGGPCRIVDSPRDFIAFPVQPRAMEEWLHLPCGHRVHLACFTQAACAHPGSADTAASLSCPVCLHHSPIVGFRADGSLALQTPSGVPLADEPPPPPIPSPPIPPPPPPAPIFGRCPLVDTASQEACPAVFFTRAEARRHICSHHQSRRHLVPDGVPVDLRALGLRVCSSCCTPVRAEDFESHLTSCPQHRFATRAAALDARPPGLQSTGVLPPPLPLGVHHCPTGGGLLGLFDDGDVFECRSCPPATSDADACLPGSDGGGDGDTPMPDAHVGSDSGSHVVDGEAGSCDGADGDADCGDSGGGDGGDGDDDGDGDSDRGGGGGGGGGGGDDSDDEGECTPDEDGDPDPTDPLDAEDPTSSYRCRLLHGSRLGGHLA